MKMELQLINLGYKTKGDYLYGVHFVTFTKNQLKSTN